MRALLLLAIVALTGAYAQTPVNTQAQARAVEDRWKNCSAIVSGRLGALHPVDDVDSSFVLTGSIVNKTHPALFNISWTYSPCVQIPGSSNFLEITLASNKVVTFDQANQEQTVSFYMPKKTGDVAHFDGTYTSSKTKNVAYVTTNCGTNTDAHTLTVDGDDYYLTVTTIEACPRFPYTNKDMPPGGVAALVVVLVLFVIQFGICGWYHMTHKSVDAQE